mmetsp:Transcript_16314/g.21356  ORF Transcript_16314/g.21356 Transcript_16314/m.21356 type:complete len:204 (-) Transcript_16314:226-837(-)|eukprot:CAMPEP_0198143530 /NCGR_PEP_ID=MMETSP1443-20131203/8403_1 /TAXON_ID=186043 /ORGANISM="Entomoneis sp., Strain CCMP2396" /LENGTH=203 /DNA_ID=CAMNT_0043806781 /DNA_START=71 /DNA_END=682 /DNA_ORIENTATION=-
MSITKNSIMIWDGIVTASPSIGATNGSFDVSWEGTLLLHADAADPSTVEDPFRKGSGTEVPSEKSFKVTGKALPVDGVADGNRFKKFTMKFNRGTGWDCDGKKHKDKELQVISSLQWLGSPDGSNSLCTAAGEDGFGRFIGLGYMKPGNRITLCRRSALQASDKRASWDAARVLKATMEEIYDEDEEDITVKPPWKCDVLNVQ